MSDNCSSILHVPSQSGVVNENESRLAACSFRLGIITGDKSARGSDGSLYINHAFGRLLESIRREVPATRLCIPVLPGVLSNLTHKLNFPDDAIFAMPPLATTVSSQRFRLQTKRVIREFSKQCDVLLIRMPFQLPGCLLSLGKPKVLHVVGNPLAVICASTDYRGVLGFFARRYGEYMHRICRTLVQEPATRVVTHGDEMWNLLNCRDGRSVVSSCLSLNEIVPRRGYDIHSPPRLLFVGYLRPEKGVGTLLDAFTLLRRTQDATLTLVGGADRWTKAGKSIQRQIDSHPFVRDIQSTGMVTFGEELFEVYRTHDVCIVPSISEGTPRTLVEARAFGCPVVASRVGGIPTSVRDGVDGLLVEPGRPTELSDAIQRLLFDKVLRRRLIKAGRERFGGHTVDKFASEIVGELRIVAKA